MRRPLAQSPFVLSSFLAFAACAGPPASSQGDPHWRPLASPTRASLRGVCTVSPDVVWVSGSQGTCLRSIDGGHTWHACPVTGAADRDLRDVHAFDARTAVVVAVGEPALVFRTDDGGATWSRTLEDARPGAFLDGVDFVDDRTGWLVGDPVDGAVALFATTDGGSTWTREVAPPPLPGEAFFAASGTSVVALPGGGVLLGSGGGPVARVLRRPSPRDPFTIHTTPLKAGAASRGIFSLARRGDRVLAVGGDYRAPNDPRGVAAWSDDAGRTWHAPRHSGPRGYRSAVAFVGRGLLAVAVGESGADLTRDGGDTWEPAGDTGYHALAFAPDGTGYAVGTGGRMAKLEFAR